MAKLRSVRTEGEEPSVLIELFNGGLGWRLNIHHNDRDFISHLERQAHALRKIQEGLSSVSGETLSKET